MATVALRRTVGPARPARTLGAVVATLALLAGCGAGQDSTTDAHLLTGAVEEDGAVPTPSPTPLAEEAAGGDEAWALEVPDEHSEVGDLVDGFPVDLLPVPGDAVVLVTSAVPVGHADIQEVSLNLRTQALADDVLALYRDALVEAGFVENPPVAPQADLAVESVFTRSGGDELVSIGVLDIDGGRTVTIGGRVHTDE